MILLESPRKGLFCVSVWFFWAIGLSEGAGRRKSRYYGGETEPLREPLRAGRKE